MPEERRFDVWVPETLDFQEAIRLKKKNLIERLFRYWWAWCIVHEADPKVTEAFDLGCGSGYGARILCETNPGLIVYGLDANEVAIAVGRQEFRLDRQVSFRRVDLDRAWKGVVRNARPRLVTAFDLVERLSNRDTFFLALVHVMDDDGLFLMNTEGKFVHDSLTNYTPDPPLKVRYSRNDLLPLLRKFFHMVMTPEHKDFPAKAWLDQVNENRRSALGHDLIACAGPRKDYGNA